MSYSVEFESFLKSLATDSEAKYRARVLQYFDYLEEHSLIPSDTNVQDYFTHLHERYMTSTLWTIYSILKSYFLYQHHCDIGQSLPGVVRLFKQWVKSEETKQSKVIELLTVLFIVNVGFL